MPDSPTSMVAESARAVREQPMPVAVRPTSRTRRLIASPATIAITTWLLATPVAFVVPRLIDLDPFNERGAFVPLAAGGGLLVILTGLVWPRGAGEWVPAAGAGLFAAWLALALRMALTGTPFGVTGLLGDRVRTTAAATHYTVTPWSSDAIIESLPSEYPPLFPWLVGRAALLVDVPAWRLLGYAEAGLTSFAVLATFLMWRRLVPAGPALALSAVGLFVYGDPRKAFAIITLFVFLPWLISAFADPPRGRLHWLPAGLIGGLIMLLYIGWFPFGAAGVLAIVLASWWRAADRAGYLRHVLLVSGVTLLVASPYLGPWLRASLAGGGEALGDRWLAVEIVTNGFPFLQPTLLGAVQLVGLAGLLWYRTRVWWSWPLLNLLLGSYLFWLVMGVRFLLTEHTTLFYYVPLLAGAVLLAAAVLTVLRAAPVLARRLGVAPPYRIGAAALAVTMLWVGFGYWQQWRPTTTPEPGSRNELTTLAHLEPMPDCTYPKYAPAQGRMGCYPIYRIRDEVAGVRGAADRPHTLASDERLYAYLPWRGYLGTHMTSAPTVARWRDRHAEVARLSGITDPAEFARASAATRFGPIDVLVLGRETPTDWVVIDQRFHPGQFDPARWVVVDDLQQPVVLAIRRP